MFSMGLWESGLYYDQAFNRGNTIAHDHLKATPVRSLCVQ